MRQVDMDVHEGVCRGTQFVKGMDAVLVLRGYGADTLPLAIGVMRVSWIVCTSFSCVRRI